ncbi:MAG: GyrI-like domain-containing protein [candidate division KSB1 bacterium]|nr:GyrI-like domain-containing protein [candidate division KSB1 bacterium]
MRALTKKILLAAGIVLGLLIVILLISAYRLGLFNRVELQQATRGPYQIVYLSHTGPYHQITEKINRVGAMLKEKNIGTLSACGIFYDDPRAVPQEQLRSKAGFLVEGEISVEAPFEIDSVAQREVIVATIKAHPAVAAFKTYPRMNEWIEQNGFEAAGPGFEIYREDGVIECELPIRPRQ